MTRANGRFGADRAEERAARSAASAREAVGPRYQWPLTVVLVGMVIALAIVASDHFRRGSVLFALCASLAFGLRLTLSDEEAGWLAVRHRRIDLIVLGFLALALCVFSLIVPSPS